MQKFRSIQVLRAVAACAVVVLHAYPSSHTPNGNAGYGAFGVDLFFVISGFIMAQIAPERSPQRFLRDRLWRIYPLWWVAVLPWLFMVPRGPIAGPKFALVRSKPRRPTALIVRPLEEGEG